MQQKEDSHPTVMSSKPLVGDRNIVFQLLEWVIWRTLHSELPINLFTCRIQYSSRGWLYCFPIIGMSYLMPLIMWFLEFSYPLNSSKKVVHEQALWGPLPKAFPKSCPCINIISFLLIVAEVFSYLLLPMICIANFIGASSCIQTWFHLRNGIFQNLSQSLLKFFLTMETILIVEKFLTFLNFNLSGTKAMMIVIVTV